VKEFCIVAVAVCMLTYPAIYIYQIRKRLIHPTLSTWIIFQFGTIISLVTYAIAEHRDFKSGILNTMDTLAVFLIIIAMVIWGDRKLLIKRFEKWYLFGLGLIVSYGLITGNAWNSNVFAQVLITVGYIPTFHNMIISKRNSESFLAWSCVWSAGFFSIPPAVINGNSLATIYAIRNVVSVSANLTLMLFYHFKSQKKT
jgi:hypothetical protein